ncbi:MAG TPA: hypothetical protein VMU64_15235 [Acidimicrobiales bacterium]|nr:hypothetical protein [Acidimicrobiales bacterium]
MSVREGIGRRPDAMWRLRESPFARAALFWVAKICVGLLAVVFLITVFFVWAFGHPVAWSVIGCLFGALPLAGLIGTIGIGLRAAVTAGPGRIGIRFFGRWRVVDLGQVRTVRLGDQGPFGGMSGFASFGGSGPFGSGGGAGGVGGGGGRTLVFEDVSGQRVEIGVDALEAGLGAVVREGLGPDVVIDVDAARALGEGPPPGDGRDHRDDDIDDIDDPEKGRGEQGIGPRP